MESRPRTGPGSRPPPRRPENSHALPKGTLPKKLQLFFAPHAPIPYAPPMKKKKPALPYTGVASYVCHFEEPVAKEDEDAAAAETGKPTERKFRNPEYAAQCRVEIETKAEKRQRLRRLRMEHNSAKISAEMRKWDPAKDEKIQGDPYKTLFLARVSYQVTERDLKKVFGEYGQIRSVRVVRDLANGKSRGYGFIEYEHTNDMKEAYKNADGVKIEGKRVLVDVERGRTMEGWRPARLGGGLGATTRKPKKAQSSRGEKPAARDTREERPHRHEPSREDRGGGRSRGDYGPSRGGGGERRMDTRSRNDYRDRGSSYREADPRDRDYGAPGRYRERDRRYDSRYEQRPSRYEKRYREAPPLEPEDRPGKKIRELEEGELDHKEVKETRRRERDMM